MLGFIPFSPTYRAAKLNNINPAQWLADTPIVLPITTDGSFARTAGFAVSLMSVSTQTTGVIRCDQPRALDIGSCNGRKIESLSAMIVDEVLAKLATILD